MTDNASAAHDAPALFLSPARVPHTITVNEQSVEMHFRPISVGMFVAIRNIATPLAKFIASVFEDRKGDVGFAQRNIKNDQGTDDVEVVTQPLMPALAAERHRQRQEAVEALVAAVTDSNNLGVLQQIVIDSAGDSLPENCRSIKGFEKHVPAPAFLQMLVGVAKANKDVFGPLAGRMATTAALVEDAIRAKVGTTASNED